MGLAEFFATNYTNYTNFHQFFVVILVKFASDF